MPLAGQTVRFVSRHTQSEQASLNEWPDGSTTMANRNCTQAAELRRGSRPTNATAGGYGATWDKHEAITAMDALGTNMPPFSCAAARPVIPV